MTALAKDLINHYETRVDEKATVAGKAMIVCMNRFIAYKLYTKIVALRPEWAVEKQAPNVELLTEKQKKELKPIPMINMVMTKDKDDPIDMFNALKDIDKDELDREFKNENSNFKLPL